MALNIKNVVPFTQNQRTPTKDSSNQAAEKKHYSNCMAEASIHATEEAEKGQPNKTVLHHYLRARTYFQEALQALEADHVDQAHYLHHVGFVCVSAAEEGQKENPNQVVIDRCNQAAECYEKAADVLSRGDTVPADYLNSAGRSFFHSALVLQKGSPLSTIASACYHQAAEFYNQAANDPERAKYLGNAGLALFHAAQALEKVPTEQATKFYRALQGKGLDLYINKAFDSSCSDQTDLLHKVTTALLDLPTDEEKLSLAQRDELSLRRPIFQDPLLIKQVTAFMRYLQIAEDLKKAVRIFDPRKPRQVAQADYLNAAALDLLEVAQEDQKESPHQKAIQYYSSAADSERKAVEALNEPDGDEEASLYHKAALSYREAAQEAQKNPPDEKKIKKLVKQAVAYRLQAQQALLSKKKSCVIM